MVLRNLVAALDGAHDGGRALTYTPGVTRALGEARAALQERAAAPSCQFCSAPHGSAHRGWCPEAEGNRSTAEFLRPPYRFEVSDHGPATVYDSIDVGWVVRVKETLPHKAEIAEIVTDALNEAANAREAR